MVYNKIEVEGSKTIFDESSGSFEFMSVIVGIYCREKGIGVSQN